MEIATAEFLKTNLSSYGQILSGIFMLPLLLIPGISLLCHKTQGHIASNKSRSEISPSSLEDE
jgi:hypothetical protein